RIAWQTSQAIGTTAGSNRDELVYPGYSTQTRVVTRTCVRPVSEAQSHAGVGAGAQRVGAVGDLIGLVEQVHDAGEQLHLFRQAIGAEQVDHHEIVRRPAEAGRIAVAVACAHGQFRAFERGDRGGRGGDIFRAAAVD